MSFGEAEYGGKRRTTRREIFLDWMEQVVPWNSLREPIGPAHRVVGRARHPCLLETMLRRHAMKSGFGDSFEKTQSRARDLKVARNNPIFAMPAVKLKADFKGGREDGSEISARFSGIANTTHRMRCRAIPRFLYNVFERRN